jgi:hypothetical protein
MRIVGEESVRLAWVYSVGTVIIGLFFYWLRSNYRVWYGVSEIVAAFALMYVAYFPHGGPVALLVASVPTTILDTMIVRAVPVLASVYAFVRGCDNFVGGLREPQI